MWHSLFRVNVAFQHVSRNNLLPIQIPRPFRVSSQQLFLPSSGWSSPQPPIAFPRNSFMSIQIFERFSRPMPSRLLYGLQSLLVLENTFFSRYITNLFRGRGSNPDTISSTSVPTPASSKISSFGMHIPKYTDSISRKGRQFRVHFEGGKPNLLSASGPAVSTGRATIDPPA